MGRALSVTELLAKKYKLLEFDSEWFEAFSQPERSGIWFIWGNSGNGKTSFVLMLIKYLAQFGQVAYDSLEESSCHTMQEAFRRVGMSDVSKHVKLLECESISELQTRLSKPKSPDFVVIDSAQYSGISFEAYKRLKEKNRNKLIIFISHAEGKQPEGRVAKRIMYDSGLKIWVEGYRAHSKGRYIGTNGGTFTIWADGAQRYWGN